MRLGVAAIARTLGGPRTYARGLLDALRRQPAAPSLRIFADDPAAFGAVNGEAVRVPGLGGAARPFAERILVPALARGVRIDLFHGTKHTLPPGLPCPAVVSIHDLAPFREPDAFGTVAGAYLRASTAAAARRARAIVTGSEATRRDLVSILGVDASRVVVIPYGVEERFRTEVPAEVLARVRMRIALGRPLVLCLGTVQPRKGQRDVLEAFARLRGRTAPAPSLLFVGRRGWLSRSFEERLARIGGEDVRWISTIADEDVPALCRAADLLVSAGRLEGFGLAVAEAMAAGLPVLALADGSIPEVVGDGGRLVPTADPDALAEAMRELLEDREARARLGAAGAARAAAYTWDASAEAHRRVYDAVLRGGALG